jgi:lipoprotein LprG
VDSDRRLTVLGWSLALMAGVLLVVVSGACDSTASPPPKLNPQTILQEAKAKADASSSVHFVLTSNVGSSGTNIVAGAGVLVRPDELQGSFSVTFKGLTLDVKVVSKGTVFEALLPFAKGYVKTNPASFGLTNPAQLMDPNTGLTSLLAHPQNPRVTSQERVAGELLDTVTFSVPGTSIPVLPDANPSKPVTLIAAIDTSSHELRQITLVGPLTSANSDSTFILTLTSYNERVNITLPPTS